MYANGATSWCSASLAWLSLFQSGRTHCDITISPFGQTIVAIVPERVFLGAEESSFLCSTKEQSECSAQLIGTGIVGLVLVSLAPFLATSLAFRISAGGVLSVLLFSMLVAFFFMRYVISTLAVGSWQFAGQFACGALRRRCTFDESRIARLRFAFYLQTKLMNVVCISW